MKTEIIEKHGWSSGWKPLETLPRNHFAQFSRAVLNLLDQCEETAHILNCWYQTAPEDRALCVARLRDLQDIYNRIVTLNGVS